MAGTNSELRDRLVESAAVPISIGTDVGAGVAISVPCLLVGFSIRENSGTAAARGRLFTGKDSGGLKVASFALVANGALTMGPDVEGVLCEAGIATFSDTGSWDGVIWVKY